VSTPMRLWWRGAMVRVLIVFWTFSNDCALVPTVTAFFQFGYQLRTGIAFKSYTYVNTSD
jgi:hypothetical protein